MKKEFKHFIEDILLLLSIMAVIAIILTACTTPGDQLTPQQKFQTFCTSANTVNTIILDTPGVLPSVVENVNKAQVILNNVCANGATLTALNLQSLQKDGIPLINLIIGALPPTPANEALKLNVSIAELIIPQLLATLPVKP